MTRVLDIGAGVEPDARATETVDLFCKADHQFDLAEEWPLETASAHGIVANHVVEHLDASHIFSEAGRVLVDGGWFELTVPLGRDAVADPDHETRWTYWTPRMFCQRARREDGRAWDAATPFVLDERSVDVWLLGPWRRLSVVFNAAAQRWPAWGARRCGAGELTATYRRVGR